MALSPGTYGFDDLKVGDTYDTGSAAVTGAHIDGFAQISGDFFGVHLDDAFARELGFPSRIAHGLLGLSMTDGLKNQAPVRLSAVASLGWNWRFRAPVLVNDRIRATIVVKRRFLSRKGQGVVVLHLTVTNQAGTIVQSGTTTLLLKRLAS